MNPPRAVIIDRNRTTASLFRRRLENHPLGFTTYEFPTREKALTDLLEDEISPQLFVFDYHDLGQNSPDALTALQTTYPLAAFILLSDKEDEAIRRLRRQSRTSSVEWAPKVGELDEAYSLVDTFRKKGKLGIQLSIAISGLGRLGRDFLFKANESRFAADIHAYTSQTTLQCLIRELKQKKPNLYHKLRHERRIRKDPYLFFRYLIELPESGKTTFHKSLDDLLDAHPDILFITTGEHITDISNYKDRKDVFEANEPKVRAALEAARRKKYKGLIVIETNPPGPFLRIAQIEYGFSQEQVTSVSADSIRYRQNLASFLSANRDAKKLAGDNRYLQYTHQLQPENIYLPVIGEHGEEHPLLNRCRVNGCLLSVLDPEMFHPNSVYLDHLLEQTRSVGTNAMIAVDILGDNYKRTSKELLRFLIEIATYQERPSVSLYSHFPQTGFDGVFFSNLTRVVYPTTRTPYIRVVPDSEFDFDSSPECLKAELYRQALEQIELSGKPRRLEILGYFNESDLQTSPKHFNTEIPSFAKV